MKILALLLCRCLYLEEWEGLKVKIGKLVTLLEDPSTIVAPVHVQHLLISGEDHRNRLHPGYDFIAILRAIWRYASRGTVEGASTIEQQLVRTITGNYEKTVSRKIKEMALASLVVGHFGKHRLPSLYLHVGYFGWNMQGYPAACRRLRIDPLNLSLEEAAVVVARLKYPEPESYSTARSFQIEKRKRHLLHLHKIHEAAGIYG